MKYRITIRRWETTCKDITLDVEASGYRLGEQEAIARATLEPADSERWQNIRGGLDVSYEVATREYPKK